MKTYQEILAEVKEKNPEMSHKDAQKSASQILREAKAAEAKEKEESGDEPGDGDKAKAAPSIDIALSDKIEAAILGDNHTYDKNKILQVANSFGDFKLIEEGKDGVNTRVYLDGPTRVPASGYFKIFIAR